MALMHAHAYTLVQFSRNISRIVSWHEYIILLKQPMRNDIHIRRVYISYWRSSYTDFVENRNNRKCWKRAVVGIEAASGGSSVTWASLGGETLRESAVSVRRGSRTVRVSCACGSECREAGGRGRIGIAVWEEARRWVCLSPWWTARAPVSARCYARCVTPSGSSTGRARGRVAAVVHEILPICLSLALPPFRFGRII